MTGPWFVVERLTGTTRGLGKVVRVGLDGREADQVAKSVEPQFFRYCAADVRQWKSRKPPEVGMRVRYDVESCGPHDPALEKWSMDRAIERFDAVFGTEEEG